MGHIFHKQASFWGLTLILATISFHSGLGQIQDEIQYDRPNRFSRSSSLNWIQLMEKSFQTEIQEEKDALYSDACVQFIKGRRNQSENHSGCSDFLRSCTATFPSAKGRAACFDARGICLNKYKGGNQSSEGFLPYSATYSGPMEGFEASKSSVKKYWKRNSIRSGKEQDVFSSGHFQGIQTDGNVRSHMQKSPSTPNPFPQIPQSASKASNSSACSDFVSNCLKGLLPSDNQDPSTKRRNLVAIAEASKERIPHIIEQCVDILNRKGIKEEFIHRKSAVKDDITETLRQVDKGHSINWNREKDQDMHLISNILRYYLRSLSPRLIEPLVYDNIRLIISKPTPKETSKVGRVLQQLQNLHITHIRTLNLVMHHLRLVTNNSKDNRMPIRALSKVFSTNLMEDPGADPKLPSIEILEFLLTHYDALFPIRRTLSSL